MNVENILSQYLNAMRARHTLITNYIPETRGKPPKPITVVGATDKLEAIYVQIGVENKVLRIDSTNFTDWTREKGYSRQIVTRCLDKEYGCKTVRGHIGGGTQYSSLANCYMLEIHLGGTPLAAIFDGEA